MVGSAALCLKDLGEGRWPVVGAGPWTVAGRGSRVQGPSAPGVSHARTRGFSLCSRVWGDRRPEALAGGSSGGSAFSFHFVPVPHVVPRSEVKRCVCLPFRPLRSLPLQVAVLQPGARQGVLERRADTGCWAPPRAADSVRQGGARGSAFLVSSQVMPFENHCGETLTFNKTNKRSYWVYSRKKMHGIYCYLDWTLYCFSLSGCWLLH